MAQRKNARSKSKLSQEYLLTQSTLAGLSGIATSINQGMGAGFIVSGPFGSGKTRFLMALQELSLTGSAPWLQRGVENLGELNTQEIWFVRQVFELRRAASCYKNLSGSTQSLAAVFGDVISQQLQASLPGEIDLLEYLDAVDAGLLASNRDTLIVMLDELAFHLASKNVSDALQDVLFLQRISEILHRHRLVLVLTAQKNFTLFDHLPYGQLAQLQQRFSAIPLHVEGDLATRFRVHFDEKGQHIVEPFAYSQRLEKALEIYKQYVGREPYTGWAETGLSEATERLEEIGRLSASAQQALTDGAYAQAEHLYGELIERDSDNPQAEAGLARARQIQHLINNSQKELEQQGFVAAYRSLHRALALDPVSVRLARQIKSVQRTGLQMLLDKLRSARAKGDHSSVIQSFRDITQLAGGNRESDAEESVIQGQALEMFRASAMELGEKVAESNDFQQLGELLGEMMQLDPSMTSVLPQSLIELVKSQKPKVAYARESSARAPSHTAPAPARSLAKLLLERCDRDDLRSYLQSTDIKGRSLRAKILELCVEQDPFTILTDFFNVSGLRKLAQDLEVQLEPTTGVDKLREAVLVTLGFSVPKGPTGLTTYMQALSRLRGLLQMQYERHEIIGVGIQACDDIGEAVLIDLIHFYCTLLMGAEYEQVLRERRLLPRNARKGINRLTFGQKVQLLERLNIDLQSDQEALNLMHEWFDRGWIVRTEIHVEEYLKPVLSRRNHFAHPEELDDRTLKREANEALSLLVELFKDFEKEAVYPAVIAVEAIHIDKFGRRTYVCADDRGYPERLFTDSELDVGREYFFYPVGNPLRVDPLIIPKR